MKKVMILRNLPKLCIKILLLVGASHSNLSAQTGFTGGFAIENWEKTEIDDGTTELFGVTDTEAEFIYKVDRGSPGGPGVPARFADFTLTSPFNAKITFDWEFTGNHRWWEAYEEFHVVVNGEEVSTPLPEFKSVGDFSHLGVEQTVSVRAGDSVGFRIGGRNFDSTSLLDGVLRITNFAVVELPGEAIEISLTRNEGNPETWDFEWPAREDKLYDLLSTTDLSSPLENWDVREADIAPEGPRARLEAVEVDDAERYFVVVEKSSP